MRIRRARCCREKTKSTHDSMTWLGWTYRHLRVNLLSTHRQPPRGNQKARAHRRSLSPTLNAQTPNTSKSANTYVGCYTTSTVVYTVVYITLHYTI